MFDQFLDSFRKASESFIQVQQDMMKQWTQQWLTNPPSTGATTEWGRAFQRRIIDSMVDALNKHREALDASYRAGIEALQQIFQVSPDKSPEDYRRTAEDLWRKLFDAFRSQYETQLRDIQKFTEMSFEMAQRPQQAPAS